MTDRPADSDRPTVLPGILFMLLAIGLWSGHDAASKWLASTYPVLVVLFWRNLFALAPAGLLVMKRGGLQPLPPRLLAVCWLRGVGGAFYYGAYVFALPLMPLADVMAIGMSGPVLIMVLSSLILRERLDAPRWIAALIAFAAVLYMVRPGGAMDPVGATLIVGGTLLYALMMVLTRHLSGLVDGATFNWHTSCGTFATMALGTLVVFAWPDAADLALFALVGAITGLANFCMIQAFRLAPASVVAPFEYSAMLWAILFGFLIWGELPGWDVLGGGAVIVATGLFLLYRQRVA